MGGVLALDAGILRDIAAAVARARKHPIPWDVLKRHATTDPTPYLKLADRKPGPRPRSEAVDIPIGYRLNISFEVQPAGLCQHISISSPDPVNNIPNDIALAMLAQACGMQWPPGENARVWIEDFVAGPMVGKAINIVEVVELARQ